MDIKPELSFLRYLSDRWEMEVKLQLNACRKYAKTDYQKKYNIDIL